MPRPPRPVASDGGSRVLVVEDDASMQQILLTNLEARGYDVEVAAGGREALDLTATFQPEAVVLDLGLPDLDGLQVVAGLRGWTSVPIIILTARDDEAAKITALDAGADDYVTKPFGMEELLARLRAALRRRPGAAHGPVVTTADFTVDLDACRVRRDGVDIRLTPTEWHVLEQLVEHRGKLVTQRQLLQEVWGPEYSTETNYLRLYVAQLRKKLEPDPGAPRYLITEPGAGYRFDQSGGDGGRRAAQSGSSGTKR